MLSLVKHQIFMALDIRVAVDYLLDGLPLVILHSIQKLFIVVPEQSLVVWLTFLVSNRGIGLCLLFNLLVFSLIPAFNFANRVIFIQVINCILIFKV